MSPPTISICHAIYRLDYGGMENGLINLINGLGPEFEHTILTLAGSSAFANRIRMPVRHVDLAKRPGQDWGLYRRAYDFLNANRFDIFHSRNLATLELQLPARLAGVPFRIHGEHGLDMHDLENVRARYRWMRRIIGTGVHRFVALSEALERYLIAAVRLPPERVRRICNGVDCQRFLPAETAALRRDARQILPAPLRPGFLFGSVGRMQPVKDPLTLVDAFIALCRQTPGAVVGAPGLVMIGDGPLREVALQRLADAELAERAWLPGSREDVAALLPLMDVFVLPSLAEGISNAILEAMAAGLPVVAAAVGGNPELVVEGHTGRLVPAGDAAALAAAMAAFHAAPEIAAGAGVAARARALESFSLDTMVARYRSLYLEGYDGR